MSSLTFYNDMYALTSRRSLLKDIFQLVEIEWVIWLLFVDTINRTPRLGLHYALMVSSLDIASSAVTRTRRSTTLCEEILLGREKIGETGDIIELGISA